jgi:TonB family protein
MFILSGILGLAVASYAQSSYVEQHLRDQYLDKTFLLRGFYSGNRLRYDSTGLPLAGAKSGDWTGDGFVLINNFHFSHKRLIVEAQRLSVVRDHKEFQLRPVEQTTQQDGTKPVVVEIKVDLGQENSIQQFDDALSKIFLTENDHLPDLIPDYWKPCVPAGSAGQDPNCHFSQEVLAIPGVAPSHADSSITELGKEGSPPTSFTGMSSIGKGVSPPKATYTPEPEFSEPARQTKYQGVVTLTLTVNKEGLPTDIHILTPLGAGLDAQAVRAVEKWKFNPAEKDGQPVDAKIAVEVDFHLY